MTENVKIAGVSYLKWFRPVIEALKKLNGSGTPTQVREIIRSFCPIDGSFNIAI